MQFKHPEILWALLLLLIPIFIHLFQLRRFKRTPFTNVAMLQKVVAESRKSNTLKKWLLLLTRLLLIAALVIAFAQPFFASNTALTDKETVIYLDNSFSMQAKNNGLSLLEQSVQDLIKHAGDDEVFSLFTNGHTYKNVSLKEIQNELLSLNHTHDQLSMDAVYLKANSLFSSSTNTLKRIVLISDFQQNMFSDNVELDTRLETYFVPQRTTLAQNTSIDSIFVEEHPTEQSKLSVLLSGGDAEEPLPISLFNQNLLIAKTSANFTANGTARVEFTIPSNTEIQGLLSIQDHSLAYDNQFYFNIDKKEKIKVLSISESDSDYLRRLFRQEEFEFQNYELGQLDYSALDGQNVVILNGIAAIPNGLQQTLRTFKQDGGTIIVVPSMESDLISYNQFLSSFFATRMVRPYNTEKQITGISFDHPLYQNVFEKRVQNFQFPSTNNAYQVTTRAPRILSLEGGEPFLSGLDGFYFFTAALDLENSNFKNSPLIVPTFYNMAAFSLKSPETQHTLGNHTEIDLATNLGNDNILKVSKENYEFIPRQQSFPNRVRLEFDENPEEDGIYGIDKSGEVLRHISFNYPRSESYLNYLPLTSMNNVDIQDSISGLFEHLEAENSITAYWKWFVILALFLALVEVLIQKFVT
ncbi:BatA domain-containing protein [Flagellimonas myxillae]|uniref:BatA domain-containing protein n=1 Tax=Flagellimonas myxillae TaxID=2942214 RepID=UPI00201EB75D|nr:BatA domain-containing protein [Muricauda myxillae]MCL6266082.1 BatA domain-containing protein [Muricauda myxillae]